MTNEKRKLNDKDQGSHNPSKRRRSAASKEIDYNDDKNDEEDSSYTVSDYDDSDVSLGNKEESREADKSRSDDDSDQGKADKSRSDDDSDQGNDANDEEEIVDEPALEDNDEFAKTHPDYSRPGPPPKDPNNSSPENKEFTKRGTIPNQRAPSPAGGSTDEDDLGQALKNIRIQESIIKEALKAKRKSRKAEEKRLSQSEEPVRRNESVDERNSSAAANKAKVSPETKRAYQRMLDKDVKERLQKEKTLQPAASKGKASILLVNLSDESNANSSPRRKSKSKPQASVAKERRHNVQPDLKGGSTQPSAAAKPAQGITPENDPELEKAIDTLVEATELETEVANAKAKKNTTDDDQVFKPPSELAGSNKPLKRRFDQALTSKASKNGLKKKYDRPSTSVTNSQDEDETVSTEKMSTARKRVSKTSTQEEPSTSTHVAPKTPKKSSDSSLQNDESMEDQSNGNNDSAEQPREISEETDARSDDFTTDDKIEEVLDAYRALKAQCHGLKRFNQELMDAVATRDTMLQTLKQRGATKPNEKIKQLEAMVKAQERDLDAKLRETQAAKQRARSWADNFECLYGWLQRGSGLFHSMYRLSYTNAETVSIETNELQKTFYEQIKEAVKAREGEGLQSPGAQLCGKGLAQVTSGFFSHWRDKRQDGIKQVADCLFARCRIKEEDGTYCNLEVGGITVATEAQDGRIVAFSPGHEGIKVMTAHQRTHFRIYCPICHRGYTKAQEVIHGSEDLERPKSCPYNDCLYNHLMKNGLQPELENVRCKNYTFYAHVKINSKGERRNKHVVRDFERICLVCCKDETTQALLARNSVYSDAYQLNQYYHSMLSCKNPFCYENPKKKCKADYHDSSADDKIRLEKAKKWSKKGEEEAKGTKNQGKGKKNRNRS